MKKVVLILLFICPIFLWADSWDNLTLKQAKQVSEFLKSNPYILDYCDCCSHDGNYATKVYLMKVKSTEIIVCEWDSKYYSVKATVDVLSNIPYLKEGPDIRAASVYKSKKELLMSMNYTWAYNKEKEKATPLYSIIPYDVYEEDYSLNSGTCKEFISFPKPVFVKNRKYKKWYKKRMKKDI